MRYHTSTVHTSIIGYITIRAIALRLYMALMVSNCSGERSFSKLALIKSKLCSTMKAWALDAKARDRDETETLTFRDRDETETLTSPAETRPRRHACSSRDVIETLKYKFISFTFIVFSVLLWRAIVTTLSVQTAYGTICMFARKLLNWSWARDVNGRDRDETETSASRDRDETETLTIFLETRPRRDVGTSRDRDVETETTTLHERQSFDGSRVVERREWCFLWNSFRGHHWHICHD